MRKHKLKVTVKKKRYSRKNGFAFVPFLFGIVCLLLAASAYYVIIVKKSADAPAMQTQTQAKSNTPAISGVPQGVNQFLDESDIAQIRSHGATIYTGNTPPNITGEYFLNSLS